MCTGMHGAKIKQIIRTAKRFGRKICITQRKVVEESRMIVRATSCLAPEKVFPHWKQVVSSAETSCFQCGNNFL